MYGKMYVLALWSYLLPTVAISSMLWSTSTSDDREKNYSMMRYQLDANTMRNYDYEEDLIRYNLPKFTKKSTIDNDVMQYMYRMNFMNNNRENDNLIQYKFQTYAVKKYENNQTPVQSYINSSESSIKKNFMSREIHGNSIETWKDENDSMLYDFFENFDRYNIIPNEICDNITCIRLCCPFGNRLVNGKCVAEQSNFIFLETIYGYISDSLQNKNKRIDNLFLLIVHDPCQKTGHYLLSSELNTFLINGSFYLPYYNTIVESTSYCLAVVDRNIFAVNVCFDVMEDIMNKTIKHNKNTIDPGYIEESWIYIKDNSNRNNNKNSIISDKMCNNITCIRLCCPFGNRLIKEKCLAGQGNFIFLQNIKGYISDSSRNENKSADKLFLLIVHDPCQKTGHYFFYPHDNMFSDDGSCYLHEYNVTIESTSYCLAVIDTGTDIPQYEFTVNVCLDIANKFIKDVDTPINQDKNAVVRTSTIIYMCGFLGSLLFSLVMFIAYSIIPELHNIHGFILRGYSGSIAVVNTIELIKIFIRRDDMEDFICITYAFIKYYFFMASWFWLNVMSINMWCTFRQLRSLQSDVKQQERKKLIMYSAYGWGGPFIISIICGIMDFVPDVPENFRPKFDKECWFDNYMTRMLYVHGIVTICIISIIWLCICTTRKIADYEKDIAYHRRVSENRLYKNSKKWFYLYLKATKMLFIIFCIKSPMNVLNVLQQFFIFIIFAWKRKIRQSLLKRFGCHN
ncbi:hypothetical protein ACFW04_011932 [Cataglyphis niger]